MEIHNEDTRMANFVFASLLMLLMMFLLMLLFAKVYAFVIP
jgi:hypothetical protein